MKFKERKIKYKIILGMIIGFIISMSIVYAVSYTGSGNVISYNNSNSGLVSNDVQSALDELYNKKYKCPSGMLCFEEKDNLKFGDYVLMTPTLTSATTDTAKTGYSSSQTFNPSELNLWRVISLNDDGTVDIISEYISSVDIKFNGQTGYVNFVGYLNELASMYENSAYTIGARHFGYNGQTEYITDTSKFTSTAPWSCSTDDDSCNSIESQGGGDKLYERDVNLVKSVFGTLGARVAGGTDVDLYWYWVASRSYLYSSSSSYEFCGRIVDKWTSEFKNFTIRMYGGSFYYGYSGRLRPIVTLKSGLTYSGVGNKEFPMEIVG